MLLMFYVRVREIHQPDWQKQHSYLGQSNSLPIISFLPLQHGWLMYFGLMGFHNQLYTFHTLVNLLVTILFYIHVRHQKLKHLGTIKLACCKVCHGQLVALSMTWHQHRAEVQASQSDAIRSIEVWNIPSQAENCEALECWRSLFGLAKKRSANLLEPLRSFVKTLQIVLRTGFTIPCHLMHLI